MALVNFGNLFRNFDFNGLFFRYADDMLDCCAPLSVIQSRGITFTEFACLAKCNSLSVYSKRFFPGISFYAEFERDVRQACSSNDHHLVVSFDRGSLNQTGVGHFSPIGAYHSDRKLVLVLDVARFKVKITF